MFTVGRKLKTGCLEPCAHYWYIDNKNYGKCVKCRKERDFAPGIEKYESKFNEYEELL